MTKREELMTILKIVERAESMGITHGDRITNMMDIQNAHKEFNLRLEEFLNAGEGDFCHDYCGIQYHIDRRTCKMGGCFIPRFAS